MSNLIGKRIECHLELSHGDKTPFVCDVKPGRAEGEVYLQPVGTNPPGGKGYVPVGIIFVRQFVEPEAAVPANVTLMPPSPAPASPSPGGEGRDEGGPANQTVPVPIPAPPTPSAASPATAQPQLIPTGDPATDLTDERRLSESPVSSETRRRRGRGGPADHGANAETPDAFQEKK